MSTPQKSYLQQLAAERSGGRATEHSFRPALKTLVEALGGDSITATNEPMRVACGAPDFIVERGGVPIGHIECKKIGADLDEAERSEQLLRYRAGLPNLILTDYLRFRWFRDGELRMKEVQLGRPEPGEQQILRGNGSALRAMFDGFFAAEPPVVETPDELAKRMAALAHLLREGVLRLLKEESGKEAGPQRELFEAYRRVLMRGLSEEDFADMQAQTVAYGLFAARRLELNARDFTRQSAIFARTTPFLRHILTRLAGPDMDPRIAWIADDLAVLLARADMAAVLDQFGSGSEERDPVVHFYESFLAAYDPRLREMRGVYYTPESAVSYIVRSVDRLLRAKFGIADGLADSTAIRGTEGEQPRVMILDPAAGTGTFLARVIQCAHDTLREKKLGGAWTSYVQRSLLPRLFGFEFLMAPYVICHLKLALKFAETGAATDFGVGARGSNGERLHVYLTNTLESAADSANGNLFMAHELEREAKNANAVKSEKPVMVVLGNPPYSGHSANKSEWIEDLMRGNEGGKCCANYFQVDGQPLGERNPKWLNDDYVKFIRFAQWRIEQTGEGIIGFITNHAWLDNPTFRGMRQSLLDSFDEIYVLDLHGNARKKERAPDGGRDENVFDIQQGVAISLFVKKRAKKQKPQRAQVYHADLWGERRAGQDGGKLGWLEENDVKTTQWAALTPKAPFYLFVPQDESSAGEYEQGWKVTDIFPVNSAGVVTARDKFTIHWTEEELKRTVTEFVSLSEEEARHRFDLGADTRDWKVALAQEDLSEHPNAAEHIKPILYRPFDTRFTWFTGQSRGFICMPRAEVMRHMLAGENISLVLCRQFKASASYHHAFITNRIFESSLVSNKTSEIGYGFPLYCYPAPGEEAETDSARIPNLNPEFITALEQRLGLTFTPGKKAARKFTPENIAHYIYAVLHSPAYRSRYADFLKRDFPRIPLPESPDTFRTLSRLGAKLAALHLMETDPPKAGKPFYPVPGNSQIEKVRYIPQPTGRVWINKMQYFEPVPPEVWNFTIGGYQPAQKWLKDRNGRKLCHNELMHYRHICGTLAQMHRLMATIDDTFQPTPESTPNA